MGNPNLKKRKGMRAHIHDIRSSLQSLLVANEMVLEDRETGRRNNVLLKTMLSDIRRIHQVVTDIEKDIGEGET